MRSLWATILFLLFSCASVTYEDATITDVSCEATSSLTFPIEIEIGEGITEADLYLVQEAILVVNNEVGAQVFSIGSGSFGDIHHCGVVFLSRGYVPTTPDAVTLGYWWPSFVRTTVCSATVHLAENLTLDIVPIITRHELYHTLGLGHDEVGYSIMNAYPQEGSILLDRDRETVRNLVNRGNTATCNL